MENVSHLRGHHHFATPAQSALYIRLPEVAPAVRSHHGGRDGDHRAVFVVEAHVIDRQGQPLADSAGDGKLGFKPFSRPGVLSHVVDGGAEPLELL